MVFIKIELVRKPGKKLRTSNVDAKTSIDQFALAVEPVRWKESNIGHRNKLA